MAAGVYALAAFMLSVLICEGGRKIHKNCLKNVLRNPQEFFDTNPVGRILNRFSQDVSIMDVGIAPFLKDTLICASEVKHDVQVSSIPRRIAHNLVIIMICCDSEGVCFLAGHRCCDYYYIHCSVVPHCSHPDRCRLLLRTGSSRLIG